MKSTILIATLVLTSFSLFAQGGGSSLPATTCDTMSIYDVLLNNAVCIDTLDYVRAIFSNNYPDSSYTSFTFGLGSPSVDVTATENEYYACLNPEPADTFVYVELTTQNSKGTINCPGYTFGLLINGVVINPGAGIYYSDADGTHEEWSAEALTLNRGWDENDAHKQSSDGLYHYHGNPDVFADSLGFNDPANHSGIIGWAADGYPIYYKYVYSDPSDAGSAIVEVESCWGLKNGDRSLEGLSNYPSGNYDGTYQLDYQYPAIGTPVANCELDSANGRWAVTPEFPSGTYHYIITDNWPYMPRYFRGTPDNSFRKGPGSCTNSTTEDDCSTTVFDASAYLPVELSRFVGKAMEDHNLLEWATLSEFNNSHFELERSDNGVDFYLLDNVVSNHYSSITRQYSFYDFNLLRQGAGQVSASVFYYRLKIVDYNGQFEYSNVISISNNPNQNSIGQMQPNPSNAVSVLPLKLVRPGKVSVKIFSAMGQLIRQSQIDLEEGNHAIALDLNDLAAQLYIVTIELNGEHHIRRIVRSE